MAQLPDPPLPKKPLRRMPDWKREWVRLLFWELALLVTFFIGGVIYAVHAVIVNDGHPLGYPGVFIILGAVVGGIFHRLRHIREDLRTYRG
jgi:hypothetical protein